MRVKSPAIRLEGFYKVALLKKLGSDLKKALVKKLKVCRPRKS